MFIVVLLTIAKNWKQCKCPSNDAGMDKQVTVYPYNGILFSNKWNKLLWEFPGGQVVKIQALSLQGLVQSLVGEDPTGSHGLHPKREWRLLPLQYFCTQKYVKISKTMLA